MFYNCQSEGGLNLRASKRWAGFITIKSAVEPDNKPDPGSTIFRDQGEYSTKAVNLVVRLNYETSSSQALIVDRRKIPY